MMVRLRPATPDDAATMARLIVDSMREGAAGHYNEDQLAALAPPDMGMEGIDDAVFDDTDRYAIIAERDGDVVGFGVVRLDGGVIAATHVDPDHAGEGIGRAVVERLEARAREAGHESVTVQSSLNAVGFYEALDYEQVSEVDVGGPDGPEIPAVELSKEL